MTRYDDRRTRRPRYDRDDDRDFGDRAGDEVRSWFGDDDAERRRRRDEMRDERYDDDRPRRRYARDYDDDDFDDRRRSRRYASSDYDRDFDDDRRRSRDRDDYLDDRYEARYNRRHARDFGDENGYRGRYEGDFGPSRYGRGRSNRYDDDFDSGRQRYGRGMSRSGDDHEFRDRDDRTYGDSRRSGTRSRRDDGAYVTYTEFLIVPGPMSGRGPEGYTRSTDRMVEQVNERLTDDGRVDASNIQVSCENGDVTLSGTVSSRSEKRRAEDIAESVRGVDDVHNRLTIRDADEGESDEKVSNANRDRSASKGSTKKGSKRGKKATAEASAS